MPDQQLKSMLPAVTSSKFHQQDFTHHHHPSLSIYLGFKNIYVPTFGSSVLFTSTVGQLKFYNTYHAEVLSAPEQLAQRIPLLL